MTISMYQASVPTFIHMLNNLVNILEKGAAHAEAKKVDPAVLVSYRLFPDMYALARQVQIACDMAKNGCARLAGMEPPKFEDNEATFAELIARAKKTIDFLNTLTAAQIDGSEERAISFKIREKEFNFKGQDFLLHWSIPNLHFHVTTTYNILRHNGVELSKTDFLGKVS